MKTLLLLFTLFIFLIEPFNATAQDHKGAEFELKKGGIPEMIGENEDYAIFRISKPFMPNTYNYYQVSKQDGSVKTSEFVFNNSSFFGVLNAKTQGDYLYELIAVPGETNMHKLVKRSINTFEMESEVTCIDGISLAEILNRTDIFVDENGVYLKYYAPGKEHKLKHYSLSLDFEWEVDLTEFLPSSNVSEYLKGVYHGQDLGSITLAIDLTGDEEYKYFEKRPEAENSIIALIIFDASGNKTEFIPSFETPITYSKSDYYFDSDVKEVTAIYRIHFEEEGAAGGVIRRSGYAFYKWNIETGELINHVEKKYTFGDVIQSNRTSLFSSGDAAKDKGEYFIGLESPVVNRLNNGTYLMDYSFYYYPDNRYLVCLNSDGTERWTDVANTSKAALVNADLSLSSVAGPVYEVRNSEDGELMFSFPQKELFASVGKGINKNLCFVDMTGEKIFVCSKVKGKMFAYTIKNFEK